MKVLFVIPYLSNSSLAKFQKNKTGFGILLNQMAKYIGNGCELLIFTNVITPELKIYNSTIIKHTWWDVFKNTTAKDFIGGVREALKGGQSFKERLLCIYYKINCGVLRCAILKLKLDVIHCHGVGKKLNWYYETSKSTGFPVLMTLHGLIGLTDVSDLDKLAECMFLKQAEKANNPVTVISTGIKRRLIGEHYQLPSTDNVTVIPNGTDVVPRKVTENIRNKYGIKQSDKLLVAVGNVCYRKNQMQIVKALALLPEKTLNDVRLLIVGTVSKNYPIRAEIKEQRLSDRVTLVGFVPYEEIQNYYSVANLNILTSKDEGFGLSMIEGFVYGVPCVTFYDLDAVPDIYDERAVFLCESRTDEALAGSIETALNRCWDTEAIREYSKKFSFKKMAEQYMDLYKRLVADNE